MRQEAGLGGLSVDEWGFGAKFMAHYAWNYSIINGG